MFELDNVVVKKYDRSIPNVSFDNSNMLWELIQLFDSGADIYRYMGLLLLRLGFEPEDNVLFCNFDKKDYSFDCVLNKNKICRIKINNGSNEIIVNKNNEEYGYLCEPLSYSEIGMRVSLGYYRYVYADGMVFTRYLSREEAKFVVSFDDYFLELQLKKSDNIVLPLFDEFGNYAKYRLDNEKELIKYMCSYTFNSSFYEVYKKICEEYLIDTSEYSMISLRKYRMINKGDIKVTDVIVLNNGELELFGMTEYDRTIFLDKDGNWSYEMPMEGTMPVSFLLSFQDGRKSCVFLSDEDDEFLMNYLNENLKEDIEIALDQVSYTKKRVLELFDNNRGIK